jgi:hypothetical protein
MAAMRTDMYTERRYPRRPEKSPDRNSVTPHPVEVKKKRLVAVACDTANSSSIRGMIGEKIVLTLKFMNQMNQRKARNNSPFPFIA